MGRGLPRMTSKKRPKTAAGNRQYRKYPAEARALDAINDILLILAEVPYLVAVVSVVRSIPQPDIKLRI